MQCFPKLDVNRTPSLKLLLSSLERLWFWKMWFREAALNEFWVMSIQVLYIPALLTLWTKEIEIYWLWSFFPRFVSDLLYEFWQIPNLQGNVSIYSLVGISRETHGQILNFWICGFEPVVIYLLIGPGQDVYVRLYYNK